MPPGAAERDLDAEVPGHRRLQQGRAVGPRGVLRVGHVHVVGLVAGHHLIAGHAVGHRVHDRPLLRRRLEPAAGLLGGQRHDFRAADVHAELVRCAPAIDPDPAPDDLARPAHAGERAAAEAEIHRRLAKTLGPLPALHEVRRGCASRDLEHPHPVVGRSRLVPVTPADVVERVLDRLAERRMDPLGEQAVEPRALVHLVEVHERLALEQHPRRAFGRDRRPLRIVEHPFHEIARREQVLEALLVLDPDRVAAVAVGDPQGGHVHPALEQHLLPRELGLLVAAEVEPHARLLQPAEHRPTLGLARSHRLVVERALAEPFLEHARGLQQPVGDDGVFHAHAALVEHAHQRLAPAEVGGERLGPRGEVAGDAHLLQGHHVARVVVDRPRAEPGVEMPLEARTREVVGPDRGVGHARLRERAVEVEHADEAGPLARPVGRREDRPGVRREAGKNVVGILPDGFGHDERHVAIDPREHVEPFAGAGDEPVAAGPRHRMAALERPAGTGEGGGERLLHRLLGRPADAVGLFAKVAAGDEHRLLRGGAAG